MLNFVHDIPTKVYFGKGAISNLDKSLRQYGKNVLLVYGGGSIKRTGLYDEIMKILNEGDFTITELSGVEPNPRIGSVERGVALCRENDIEVVLAVGGGSTIDCAKAVCAGYYYEGDDLWTMARDVRGQKKSLPLVDILTISATGSDFDDSAVISNLETNEKIGNLFFLLGKKQIPVDEVCAGDIGATAKLAISQTNDTLCDKARILEMPKIKFPSPCLSKAIRPEKKGEEDKIMGGLQKLMDEDRCFTVENNAETKQMVISGLGEVQLKVLVTKLKNKFKVDAILEDAKVPYRETIRKKVKVQGKHKKQSGGHGQYGDVWIEFEPNYDTEDLVFEEKVFGGAVPKNYFPAVEKGLQESIEKGILAGYPVVNLKATLVDGSYHDVDSNEQSFKMAAHLAFKAGMEQADSIILEPISSVEIHGPEDKQGDLLGDLNKRRGRVMGIGADELGCVINAEVPTSEMGDYATDLKAMTQGLGWFAMEHARYEPAPADVSAKVIADAKANEA